MGSQGSISSSGGKNPDQTVCIMRGSKGGRGLDPPPPLVNHKGIGILSNTGPDPLEKSQSYQVSIQCWATIDPPAKRHLNGVLLAG